MTSIEEFREIIKKLHGVDTKHLESVPVTETFKCCAVWDGIVEVFELIGHPTASRLYTWSHATDNPEIPLRYVTVLYPHPIQSARDAVRAAIVQEFRDNAPSEA